MRVLPVIQYALMCKCDFFIYATIVSLLTVQGQSAIFTNFSVRIECQFNSQIHVIILIKINT